MSTSTTAGTGAVALGGERGQAGWALLALRQTWALTVDAVRELRARRLFWVTMVISLIAVGVFAGLDITDRGLVIFGYQTGTSPFNEVFNTSFMSRTFFYKLAFFAFGFGAWLSWASMILALISTAHIYPDFVQSGSIELSLSKPVGRLRLFLTKYALGLLFVCLQTVVFSAAALAVIGWRTGEWDLRLFWSVPLIMLIFSYLFSVCVLVGLVTRSQMSALLFTGVVFFVTFLSHTIEQGLLQNRVTDEVGLALNESGLEKRQAELAELQRPLPEGASAAEREERQEDIARKQEQVERWREGVEQATASAQTARDVHRVAMGVKTFLPKTNETLDLLAGLILDEGEMDRFVTRPRRNRDKQIGAASVSDRLVRTEVRRVMQQRDEWWILGTSLAFEACVLGVAAWVFCRRDF